MHSNDSDAYWRGTFGASDSQRATDIPNPYPLAQVEQRDHVAAGLFAIFLGFFGIHKFYLGYFRAGFIMMAASIVGGILTFGLAFAVTWVIAIVEGVLYLARSQTEFEKDYVLTRHEWF